MIRIGHHTGKAWDYPNFADGSNGSSVQIANALVKLLDGPAIKGQLPPQVLGDGFERCTAEFIEKAFSLLQHLRPGRWCYSTSAAIADFDQYEHLANLADRITRDKELASALGSDYIITPDIVIGRWAVSDDEINHNGPVLDSTQTIARHAPLRQANYPTPRKLLHASISCKWSIRSDRVQNSRTEALNLIRNRKGSLPHVVAVTAEPLPTRIASLALGTGDMDCVYHFALTELQAAIEQVGNIDQQDMLATLVEGRRLRDIADLPLDLAV